MAPKSKGVTNQVSSGIPALYRNLISFSNPSALDGNQWRAVCRNQPIVMDCIGSLSMHIQSLSWDIRAKDNTKTDELKPKIDHYKSVLNNANDGAGYLNFIDITLQNFYMTPFGAGTEVVKYQDGKVYSIRSLDSATLYPNPQDKLLPVIQRVNDKIIYFSPDEIVRMYFSPRPEIERYGWGMPPVEKVYLAVELLGRGDKYYANLLMDTPEAGLLDLGDMSKASAESWLVAFRELFTGIDGFKIPVIYEHTTPANYIPFTRPPTDMLFDSITLKYAQLVCAAFGITPGDIAMKSGEGGSLSSSIREERHSRATGYASAKTNITRHINAFIPDDLEFWFIDVDDELLVSKGRARSANAVAGRNLIEAGIVTPSIWRRQMQADGLITVPIPEELDDSEFDILHDISGLTDQIELQKEQIQSKKDDGLKTGGQGGFGLGKQRQMRGGKLEAVAGKEPVLPSEGGQGEIKRAGYDMDKYTKFSSLIGTEFDKVIGRMTPSKIRRIIKAASKYVAPKMKSINIEEFDEWADNYTTILFDGTDDEIITKANTEDLLGLEEILNQDKWYDIDIDDTALGEVLGEMYLKGLQDAAQNIQRALYEEGLAKDEDLIIAFLLSQREEEQMYRKALEIVKTVNKGTDFYIKRIALSSVAKAVKDYTDLDGNYLGNAEKLFSDALQAIMRTRIDTVTEYELTNIYNDGILKQYSQVGLTRKGLLHIGSDIPCENCQENEALGFVPLDYKFVGKMGETLTPPFHPNCHHILRYDEREIKNIRNPKYYTGKE